MEVVIRTAVKGDCKAIRYNSIKAKISVLVKAFVLQVSDTGAG